MLGHPHAIEQRHRFHLSLIRDSRLPSVVNDIVEECGNARFQDRIDRFVAGEDVPYDLLRQVWEDTISAAPNCDLPMYEELYRTVRQVNQRLPPARRLRVLLGDVPIVWDEVRSFDDVVRWDEQRFAHMADIVQREVVAKGRRALILYGDMHAQRKNERVNYERADNVAARLETAGAQVFNVWSNLGPDRPDVDALPGLTRLRGTALGARDFGSFFTSDGRFTFKEGKPRPLAREQWAPMRMEDQFDALLYLGPQSSMTMQRISPGRCAEASYLERRTRRMALLPGGQGQIDRLKQYCASVAR